jgi:hypothetical protein
MNLKEFIKGWRGGLPETPCGSGSKFRNTRVQRKWIPEKVEQYGITSIADIGAGDLNWARHTAFGCEYIPYDLVPRTEGVVKFDLLTEELPQADCLMVLWVLNHLTKEQAKLAANKIMQSKSRYLITTYREDFYNFMDVTVLESIGICNGTQLQLIEL